MHRNSPENYENYETIRYTDRYIVLKHKKHGTEQHRLNGRLFLTVNFHEDGKTISKISRADDNGLMHGFQHHFDEKGQPTQRLLFDRGVPAGRPGEQATLRPTG